ncbi:MFS transporter [Mesorhizobium sp. ZMM04-5]|uniref:MFS transporter n=1 Tax=Mesorhizobium marinum TaxID=3228790 RepID=A0ABV3R1H4_9HYPH
MASHSLADRPERRSGADIDGAYAWARLAIGTVLATIGGAGMWVVIVVMPSVQAEFGIDRAGASLPYTATMVGFALGNIFVGRAIDRIGYWIPALIASITLVAGFGLAAAAPSILTFTLVQAVIGAGSSVIFGPLMADISHWFERRRGVAVSIAAAGNYLAGTLWPVVVPYMMGHGGWRFTYLACGAICLVTMVPLSLMLRRRRPVREAHAQSAARVVQPISLSPAALQALLVVAGLGCCVAMSMPQVHIVAYCVDLGYGVARGGEMLSIMLAAGVVSRLASGFLADRIGGVKTLLVGSTLQCLSLLFYIPFDGLASLYIVSLVFGLSQGGIVPSYAIIVREYMPAAEAGQRIGIVVVATIAGMALGGWMSGWIYDLTGSYAAAFLNGIAWNLLNMLIAFMLLWKSGSMRPRPARA